MIGVDTAVPSEVSGGLPDNLRGILELPMLWSAAVSFQ